MREASSWSMAAAALAAAITVWSPPTTPAAALPAGEAAAHAAEEVRSGSAAAAADTTGLGSGPYASMRTVLERTLFQVDVAELTVRYDSATTARVRSLVQGTEYSESLADSVVAAVLVARRLRAEIRYLRDVGLDLFLESVRSNMEAARDAGMLADSSYVAFRRQLPGWYAALQGRGVLEGDVTSYRIRGDTLRVEYRSPSGRALIDRTDVGRSRRNAVLGGYFAPGVDFREGLIRSLFRDGESGSGS